MHTKLLKYIIYVIPLASILTLLYVFNTFDPGRVGPVGILFIFILIYLISLGVFFFVLDVGLTFVLKILNKDGKKEKTVEFKKAYYIASIAAFLPVLMLGIQSVGQLQLTDVLLVVAFLSLAIFYVVKRT